jgi:hypothetical protein
MSLYIPITSNAIPQLRDSGVDDLSIRKVLIKVSQRFTPILQKASPVDTGRLRRSLRVELLPDDSGVAMSSPVFYAGFVEFGTRKMRPRQYASQLAPDIIAYMNQLLRSLGSFTPTRIQRTGVGEQSGQVSAQVTDAFLSSIRGVRVKSATLPPITVTPQLIEGLSVSNLTVSEDNLLLP